VEDFVDDPVLTYLRAVAAIRPLTPEQEADCIRHVRARDQEAERAGKTLVEAHLAMVVSVAERYPDSPIGILDLIIEGNLGLVRALRTFRDSQEETFAVHALPHVERAIAEAIASLKAGSES
jgi:DNA-directed RNA polymerase sigma subunit (sigma70/sigma32)